MWCVEKEKKKAEEKEDGEGEEKEKEKKEEEEEICKRHDAELVRFVCNRIDISPANVLDFELFLYDLNVSSDEYDDNNNNNMMIRKLELLDWIRNL